jgi:hypothetical protein
VGGIRITHGLVVREPGVKGLFERLKPGQKNNMQTFKKMSVRM